MLDATDAFTLRVTDQAELAGLHADTLEAAREAAQRDGHDGWKFTLHFPSYLPVMQYAAHRPLREALYRAYVPRARRATPPRREGAAAAALDNAPIIDELLAIRHEEARLLGYANFAQVSLVPKMAESPEQVMKFLHDLAARARPFAERDIAELRRFAADELALPDAQAWDLAFASESSRKRATRSPTRRSSSTSRCRACSTACSR